MLRRWLVDNPVLDLSLVMAVLIVGYNLVADDGWGIE